MATPETLPPLRVVKLGGSLAEDADRVRRLLGDLAIDRKAGCAIVPGGGAFAQTVRQAQRALHFDDALAHRLALDAMHAMAQIFRAIEPRLPLAADLAAVRAARQARRAVIWTPQALRAGDPDVPETWDVTSDSLALWLAARCGAERCTLVKSADPPEPADPETLACLGLVDAAFPAFARAFAGRIVVQGPTRTVALARRESGRGVAA